jgi:hypothetical protein
MLVVCGLISGAVVFMSLMVGERSSLAPFFLAAKALARIRS